MISTRRSLAFAATALLASSALAAEPLTGFYIGAGGGQARYHSDIPVQLADAYRGSGFFLDSASVTDDTDTAWKVYGGWQFHRYAAVELGYLDLGEMRTHYEVSPTLGLPAVRDGRYRLSGVELSLVGTLPVGERVTLFAKGGALASTLKYSESGTDTVGAPSSFDAADDHQVRFVYGVGGAFRITDPLSVRVEWQRVDNIGQTGALTTTGNGKIDHVDFLSLSLAWRF